MGGGTAHNTKNVKRRQALTTRSNPGLASQQLCALEQLTVLRFNVQYTAVHFISLKTQLNFP